MSLLKCGLIIESITLYLNFLCILLVRRAKGYEDLINRTSEEIPSSSDNSSFSAGLIMFTGGTLLGVIVSAVVFGCWTILSKRGGNVRTLNDLEMNEIRQKPKISLEGMTQEE